MNSIFTRHLTRPTAQRLLACLLLCFAGHTHAAEPIVVASKNFNEGYILAEIVAQTLEAEGFAVERRFGLGGTLICYQALTNGEVDVYVEYTGTLSQAIYKLPQNSAPAALERKVASEGLEHLADFGFNNTYAMVVRPELAKQLALTKVSDLVTAPQLEAVVSHEFLERKDGWPSLSERYQLKNPVRGIEHALAYQAVADGAIDITDAFSTDGEVKRYNLFVLEDDLGFFPQYLAAPLVRKDFPVQAREALLQLGGTLDEEGMIALNAAVTFEGQTFAQVAARHLATLGLQSESASSGMWGELLNNTLRHLQLTAMALLSAIAVGLGAALALFRRPVAARVVVYICGLLQTIPSIALLALFIPIFGIGLLPAVIALFLYSLLPILRNALTALTTVDPPLIRVATAMGLSEQEQLRHVYLPLSTPAIFAGVRTAAVISIGTATLAAFIGAGGLGDPIVTGLSLNNPSLILQGAVLAAGLAVLTELLFELLERRWVPGHLRR